MSNPRVDILYFDGCPNWQETKALVERIAEELAVEPAVRVFEVRDGDAAIEHRFLGSPTVRVDGADVEPGAEARREGRQRLGVLRRKSCTVWARAAKRGQGMNFAALAKFVACPRFAHRDTNTRHLRRSTLVRPSCAHLGEVFAAYFLLSDKRRPVRKTKLCLPAPSP